MWCLQREKQSANHKLLQLSKTGLLLQIDLRY